MPEAIVDRFKVIAIEIRDGERMTIAPTPDQLARSLFIECAAICQIGQRIMVRQALLLRQGVLKFSEDKDNRAKDHAIRRELPERVTSGASRKDTSAGDHYDPSKLAIPCRSA
jgi:hypothetical protein